MLIATMIAQLPIMLARNVRLLARTPVALAAMTIIAPILLAGALAALQAADYSNQAESIPHPPANPLPGVPQCQGRNSGDPCITIMYTPATVDKGVDYTQIMRTFAALNAQRTGYQMQIEAPISSLDPPSRIRDIVAVPNPEFVYDYAAANPNATAWAVSFSQTSANNIQYQIWFNATATSDETDLFGRSVLSITRGIDEAIISVLNDPQATATASIAVDMKDWPRIPSSQRSDTIVQAVGPVVFFCSQMIIFIYAINQIVSEKELKLRLAMQVMGLSPAVYWISQLATYSAIVFTNALVTCILGLICGFQAFKNANFGVLLITFFLFGEAMVLFGFFITTLVRKSNTAVILGIFIFIIGIVFQSFVFSGAQLGYIWWSPETISPNAWKILSIVPFFNFGRMFLDITTRTTGSLDLLTDTYVPGPGFPWSALYESVPQSLTVPYGGKHYPELSISVHSWYYLIMDAFIYGVLLWYYDNVIPDEFGAGEPFYFFLLPSYWGFETAKSKSTDLQEWQKHNTTGATMIKPEGDEDSDVMAARERALDTSYFPALKIVNLRKIYRSNFLFASKKDNIAVRNSCFTVEEGTLLALLGQNGAGKSTTISMLSGLTPATSGDALIYNMSVRHQMHRIREIMGICPQHDILFDDLTAREHIELYAGLKGVPHAQWKQLIDERLKAVRLHTVANVRAGTYSGGMKRRLSLVISTIGDPKIIFMDEPTTGMDPVNRRHVWTFVEKFKHGRVIILTTHSMEEADVLGDRVAVMSKGRLRAINNSIALKNKFGAGYRISIVTEITTSHTKPDAETPSLQKLPSASTLSSTPTEDVSPIDYVKKTVSEMIPKAVLEDDSAGALLYQIPASSISAIPELVQWLESNTMAHQSTSDAQPDDETINHDRQRFIKSWGISQSTLEEVFLKLIREANAKFA